MTTVYVDTSAIAAVVLRESGWQESARRIATFDEVISSNLLEAELRATVIREGLRFHSEMVQAIDWIIPDRSLSPEFDLAADAGYLRGADLWHLAVALFSVDDPSQITFITLDERQRAVAEALGFPG